MPERVLYLASGSPRRRELVQALGMPVIATLAPFDEDAATDAYAGDPAHLAEHLARAKAEATLHARKRDLPPRAVVVAADTTVLLDGVSLGKPRDAEDARQMLARLRDRTHQVSTGVAVAASADARPTAESVRSLTVTTQVTMRVYSDAEVTAYIASGDPDDKAGAYAIQHAGFHPVAGIAGCYLAVVGLPLCALAYLLATADDATPAAQARAQPCPWSPLCRAPIPCWERPAQAEAQAR